MATHHPPLDLFAAQVASIKAQTHENWICIVSDDHSPDYLLRSMRALLDDPRFILKSHPEQLNFYGNFERALQLCPADADVVALSDQDDRWYPEKLKTLLDHLDGDAQLVSSDVRIVDRDGTTHSDTFWVSRRNNVTSLASLMAANTVMGAASLFRASLLRQILPFPERLGAAYHDHWIALNALVADQSATSTPRCMTTSSMATMSSGIRRTPTRRACWPPAGIWRRPCCVAGPSAIRSATCWCVRSTIASLSWPKRSFWRACCLPVIRHCVRMHGACSSASCASAASARPCANA